ncbi:uncharacterized protein LOC120072740 [Benincasa hispida]|uniref:uncharacterized protein LOC120072740 n=1 Tax=Benincasa hispida TaxID=102211 RepID=UPI00190034BD|nr:uncharacterized protein LOC120072740 [Benincasa hispida]
MNENVFLFEIQILCYCDFLWFHGYPVLEDMESWLAIDSFPILYAYSCGIRAAFFLSNPVCLQFHELDNTHMDIGILSWAAVNYENFQGLKDLHLALLVKLVTCKLVCWIKCEVRMNSQCH